MVRNDGYEHCGSYPESVVLPKALRWDDVGPCFTARCEGRVPALTYYHATNGCSLWRSAQPARGVRNVRSEYDAKLLAAIAKLNPVSNADGSLDGCLEIYDARTEIAA